MQSSSTGGAKADDVLKGGRTVSTGEVTPSGANVDVPNAARIYDYFLGGKDSRNCHSRLADC
jgi:hypothetical protein